MFKTFLRFNSSLVLIEHRAGRIDPSSLNVLSAASKWGPVSALVAGSQSGAVAQALANSQSVSKVIHIEQSLFDQPLPETHAKLLAEVIKTGSYSHVFAAHSAFGKNVMPRAAALLDVSQISDITAIEDEQTFVRPIYAGKGHDIDD
jgi:electron transfer flavoprotein alpha subunit